MHSPHATQRLPEPNSMKIPVGSCGGLSASGMDHCLVMGLVPNVWHFSRYASCHAQILAGIPKTQGEYASIRIASSEASPPALGILHDGLIPKDDVPACGDDHCHTSAMGT